MLTALVLLAAIAAIVILARRWTDIEAKLFPDDFDVPEKEARMEKSAVAESKAEEAEAPKAKTGLAEAVETARKAASKASKQVQATVEKTAGGLMKKKEITAEPDVEPEAVSKSTPVAEPEKKEDDFLSAMDDMDDPMPDASPSSTTPSPTMAAPKQPGARVSGSPARPSQPAYVDATKRMSETYEQLANEADQAWRDRDLDRCEQACLKILIQQPKNHKYMTRIGQVYQEQGNLEDAKEAFEAAKKLDPKNFFVLNRLSEVERMISDKGGRTGLKKAVTAAKK